MNAALRLLRVELKSYELRPAPNSQEYVLQERRRLADIEEAIQRLEA